MRRWSTAGPTSRRRRTSVPPTSCVRLRGKQFDPDLVPIFLDELERDTHGRAAA